MSYFIVCSFDLKNATSSDYQTAYLDLEKIGLHKTLRGNSGVTITLPTTTCAGEFEGESAVLLRDDITDRVTKMFTARHFSSEIFIFVSGDWAWSHRTT